jgi:hypothetical protein
VAGVLLLLSMVGGGLGEFYIPNKMIVSGDAAATAQNIVASSALYRFGFAAYLVEAICDITLALVFYALLRPVNRYVALLAAFFGLVSTAVFAGGELFYYAPTHILGGATYLSTFSTGAAADIVPAVAQAVRTLRRDLHGVLWHRNSDSLVT